MSCGCNETGGRNDLAGPANETLTLEMLFLDEETCIPCGSTSGAIAEAVAVLEPVLATLGMELRVIKTHVTGPEMAVAHEFRSSPTIRIEGRDIAPGITEDDCPTCGDLAGGETPVTCRTWEWRGEVYNAAPVGRIVEAVLAEALGEPVDGVDSAPGPYRLPDNLAGFFAAREAGRNSCC